MTDTEGTMTKDLADELERLATKLDDEPDAARRIYRTAALSLWVENNLPAILSALRSPTGEGEPVAWRWRAIFDDDSRGGWFYETGPLSRDIYTRQALEHQPLYTRPVARPEAQLIEIIERNTRRDRNGVFIGDAAAIARVLLAHYALQALGETE